MCRSSSRSPAASAKTTATAAIGELRKKIQRHETQSISAPPTGGPARVARVVPDDQRPIAHPLSPAVGGAQQAEARRRQQAAGRPLEHASDDQHPSFGAAPQIADATANPTTPARKTRRSAVPVAERAAGQIQRREHQRVREDDPLLAGEAGVEVLLDRGQREVQDGRVDERDRGPGDGRDEDEPAGSDRASLASAYPLTKPFPAPTASLQVGARIGRAVSTFGV